MIKTNFFIRLLLSIPVFLLASCTGTPDNISAVKNFELDRYLGQWYEIARLDHSFERGLSNVTANYSLNENGTVKVLNRGYSSEDQQWDEAEGRAKFVTDPPTGHLKVSFFGPFYGSYVIFKLDHKNYQYAYVTSYNRDFLWLLARTPEIPETLKNDFLETASELGFATDELIFVEHDLAEKPANTATVCKDPRPQICTMEYMPVCATRDTGVRCITSPCPSGEQATYATGCTACADESVISYVDGACGE